MVELRVECVRDPMVGEFTLGVYYPIINHGKGQFILTDDNQEPYTFTPAEVDYYFE